MSRYRPVINELEIQLMPLERLAYRINRQNVETTKADVMMQVCGWSESLVKKTLTIFFRSTSVTVYVLISDEKDE